MAVTSSPAALLLDRRFEYLLNAMEGAASAASPREAGYPEARRALFAYVAELQRAAARTPSSVEREVAAIAERLRALAPLRLFAEQSRLLDIQALQRFVADPANQELRERAVATLDHWETVTRHNIELLKAGETPGGEP